MPDPVFDPYRPPETSLDVPEFDDSDEPEPFEGNPWLTIWVWPRRTIRALIDDGKTEWVVPLSLVPGMFATLDRFALGPGNDKVSLEYQLIQALAVGAITGFLGNAIAGVLIARSGKWLGGEARWDECRGAIAWGSVPLVIVTAMILAILFAFNLEPMRIIVPNSSAILARRVILIVYSYSKLLLAVWAMVLVVRTVAEVHEFSSWRSLGALVVAVMLFYAALFAIGGLFLAGMWAFGPAR